MYLGIFLGPWSRGPHDDHDVISLCLDQAVEAAEAGFALVTFGEQHFNNYEPYCNPFLMGARLSTHLKNAYFGTTIVPLPLHNPLRLAEDINVLDVLTKGQLIVGLSSGRVGHSRDFENFGADPDRRHEMFASKLEIIRKVWAKQAADPDLIFETDFDKGGVQGPGARMMPAPYRRGGPLLAIGSNTDATNEHTGQMGLPMFLGPCPRDVAARKFALYMSALRQAGHPDELVARNFHMSMVTKFLIVGETEDEARQRADRMTVGMLKMPPPGFEPIVGDPDSIVKELRAYEAAGVGQVQVRFTVGAGNHDDMRASFDLFVKECLPALEPESFECPPRS